ncbi:MAG TPA: flippase [Terriglobales bacterium]|nr:flippase [Terriglobales bacterium]
MNATAQLTQEQSSPTAVGLTRVINNSAALFLLDLLNKAIPLIVFPRVVRALGPAVYGQLGFAAAVAGFFGLLASPGFSTYALREAAKNSESVPFLVKHVLGARMVFAAAAYALLALFTLFFAPPDHQTRLLIMLSGLAFVAGSVDTQWIFAARSRMSVIAVQGALAQLAYAGLIVALVRGSRDAWIIPSATLVSLGLSTLLIWVPARREFHIPLPEISPQTWSLFLPICLVMGFSSLMSMIYDQIDVVMLKYFRADAELGTYVASYGLMTMAMSFVPILGQVFLPLLSETAGQNSITKNGKAEKTYLLWFGNATVGLALPIAVGGFILAAPLTLFVFGSQYSGSGMLFRWLMLTIITAPAASYCGAQLIPNGREKKYLVAVLAGAATNVFLNLLFIPRYGALAAAFTTAFSQGVVALMNYLFVRDLTRPPLLTAVAISVPATAVMTVGLLLVKMFFPVHVLVLVTLGGLTYLGVYALSLSLWNSRRG